MFLKKSMLLTFMVSFETLSLTLMFFFLLFETYLLLASALTFSYNLCFIASYVV